MIEEENAGTRTRAFLCGVRREGNADQNKRPPEARARRGQELQAESPEPSARRREEQMSPAMVAAQDSASENGKQLIGVLRHSVAGEPLFDWTPQHPGRQTKCENVLSPTALRHHGRHGRLPRERA